MKTLFKKLKRKKKKTKKKKKRGIKSSRRRAERSRIRRRRGRRRARKLRHGESEGRKEAEDEGEDEEEGEHWNCVKTRVSFLFLLTKATGSTTCRATRSASSTPTSLRKCLPHPGTDCRNPFWSHPPPCTTFMFHGTRSRPSGRSNTRWSPWGNSAF